MIEPTDALITYSTAKHQLGKGETKGFTFIYNEIAAGRLKPIKIGRSTYLSQNEVNEYVEKLKQGRESGR